jgi:hypothetical protein
MRKHLWVLGLVMTASVALAAGDAAVGADPSGSSPVPSAMPQPVGEPCEIVARPFDRGAIDLTGAWGDVDGDGVYYIRQEGSRIAWNGMNGRTLPPEQLGREWDNVAIGTLGDDGTITLDWFDVPRGAILGYGTLTLLVGADASGNVQIMKTGETGTGFATALFAPCAPPPITEE